MRWVTIEDDGDAFDVAMFDDGIQVAGAIVPDDGAGTGFDLAQEIARAFAGPVGDGAVPAPYRPLSPQ